MSKLRFTVVCEVPFTPENYEEPNITLEEAARLEQEWAEGDGGNIFDIFYYHNCKITVEAING